jgi:hypothetical protein
VRSRFGEVNPCFGGFALVAVRSGRVCRTSQATLAPIVRPLPQCACLSADSIGLTLHKVAGTSASVQLRDPSATVPATKQAPPIVDAGVPETYRFWTWAPKRRAKARK